MTADLTLGSFVVYASFQFTRKSWLLLANPKPTSMTWGLPNRIATARCDLFWKALLSAQLMKFHEASWIRGTNGRWAGNGTNVDCKRWVLSILFLYAGGSKGLPKPRCMSLREGTVKTTFLFLSVRCLLLTLFLILCLSLVSLCISVLCGSIFLCMSLFFHTTSLLFVHGI